MRSMLAHCRDNEATIDNFHCSHCSWEYEIENPQVGHVGVHDAWRASSAFDSHDCARYSQRAA
jgi:hypothetical protein